jgi:hypothetical protein
MREGRAILSCGGIRLIQAIFDSAKSLIQPNLRPRQSLARHTFPEHRCLKVYVMPVALLVTKVPVQARREVT